MLDAHFVGVKTGLHVVDGPAVLNGHDATRGKALPVANSVNFVENRRGGIARTQKIRVQRVGAPSLDRTSRRHQSLGRNLAPERALALLFGIRPSKDVVVNWLNIQQTNEEFQGIGHGPLLHSALSPIVTSR